MITPEELLLEHAAGMEAQHGMEAAAEAETHAYHDHDHHPFIQQEHDRVPDHTISLKEGHACSADCPEHGSHDHDHVGHHHEASHEAEHTITQKSAGHACSADCPEHGHPHHAEPEHSHHDAKEQRRDHDHHIEHKTHACGADCPEHGGKHTPEAEHHHEHDAPHDHRIEQKAHACGADCPEHGHAHAVAKHAHHEHHTETKPREPAEAAQQAPPEQPLAGAMPYRRVEEAIRAAQLTETGEHPSTEQLHVVEHDQPHTTAAKDEVIDIVTHQASQHELQADASASENEPPAQDFTRITQPVQRREATSLEAEPDALLSVMESETEQAAVLDSLSSPEAATLTVTELNEATGDTPSDKEGAPALDPADPEAVIAIADPAEVSEEIELAETMELLELIGIELTTLPLPEVLPEHEPPLMEVDLSGKTDEPLLVQHAEAVVVLHGEVDSKAAAADIEKAATTVLEAISQRIDGIGEQIVTAAPERAQEIRKTLSILTDLQALPTPERNVEAIQIQLIQLLRLLGYENPAQTLAAYIQQYGIGFIDELQARLVELLGHGRSFESLRVFGASPVAAHSKNGASVLGIMVLWLLRWSGHFSTSGSLSWAWVRQ